MVFDEQSGECLWSLFIWSAVFIQYFQTYSVQNQTNPNYKTNIFLSPSTFNISMICFERE